MNIDVTIMQALVDPASPQGGGNPAGVVMDADALTAAQKQAIAAQVGLSETAFVSRSERADFTLEFFTPTQQIAHCGHATVAAFSWLQQQGRFSSARSSKETIDGVRDIWLDQGRVYMQQQAPVYQSLQHDQQLLASILQGAHWCSEPQLVNTGNGFALVELANFQQLQALTVDQSLLSQLSEQLDLVGLYVYTLESSDTASPAERHASSRMFAPRYGISEEAATGMAAGPLACLLQQRSGQPQANWWIEQGHAMAQPSPSLIEVKLQLARHKIQSLMAGGIASFARTLSVSI
ncbi:phenazine biosynthesis protein [Bacterioplanes sanyensis]|uniref:Phenazine biosynthesis protein n=1 Tax=Bacterioplanes sanyensis TaxID=1249553 RepID=A0A222FPP5_9GAMM|nr:PhzF family phenazine biosynthesis isomerase [Bacterioplanes sanyensis]ASP40213.1 phenazine biosynthesis protein [Bacterioplanes sanyensis]